MIGRDDPRQMAEHLVDEADRPKLGGVAVDQKRIVTTSLALRLRVKACDHSLTLWSRERLRCDVVGKTPLNGAVHQGIR